MSTSSAIAGAMTSFQDTARLRDPGTFLYLDDAPDANIVGALAYLYRDHEPPDKEHLLDLYGLAGNSDWVVEVDETNTGSAWQHWLLVFHGLSTWADWATRPDPLAQSRETRSLSPAEELRELTGLSVESLARMLGVSRVSYHNWLAGRGITQEKKTRLYKLLALLWRARERFGDGLDAWLLSPPVPGSPTPLSLLEKEEDDQVLGLLILRPALRAPVSIATMAASRRAVEASGVAAWQLKAPPVLGWTSSKDQVLAERERLLPSAQPEESLPSKDEDERAVIGIYFL